MTAGPTGHVTDGVPSLTTAAPARRGSLPGPTGGTCRPRAARGPHEDGSLAVAAVGAP